MVDIHVHIDIEMPREVVVSYAAQPDNAPEWYRNIESVNWETRRPLALHSRVQFEALFLGRRLSYLYEVVQWQPGEKLVMRTAQGPFPMETTYTWEALGPRLTRMHLRNCGKPAGFFVLLRPLIALAMKKAMRKDLLRLKKILEERGP